MQAYRSFRIETIHKVLNMPAEFDKFLDVHRLADPIVQFVAKTLNDLTDKEWDFENTTRLANQNWLSNSFFIDVYRIDDEEFNKLSNEVLNKIKTSSSIYSDKFDTELELINSQMTILKK